MTTQISAEARELAKAIKENIGKVGGVHRHDLWLPLIQAALDTAKTQAAPVVAECCVPASGEPSFVLLGRDPQAPTLIEKWALDREIAEPESNKPAQAKAIAKAMREFKNNNPTIGLSIDKLPPVAALKTEAEVRDAALEEAAKLFDGDLMAANEPANGTS